MDGMDCYNDEIKAAVARDKLKGILAREKSELKTAKSHRDRLQKEAADEEEAERV